MGCFLSARLSLLGCPLKTAVDYSEHSEHSELLPSSWSRYLYLGTYILWNYRGFWNHVVVAENILISSCVLVHSREVPLQVSKHGMSYMLLEIFYGAFIAAESKIVLENPPFLDHRPELLIQMRVGGFLDVVVTSMASCMKTRYKETIAQKDNCERMLFALKI